MIGRVGLALACVMLTAATPPVLPGPQSISEADKASGAQAHPDMLEEFGGPYRGPQSDLVRQVGLKVAAQTGIANSGTAFTFTLLDSPVENAFAIPGGYVYTTRALLALMNNEDELAFVLGHEAGHIAAHHSDKRNKVTQRSAVLGALGQAVLGQVLGNGAMGQFGQKLGQAGINRLMVGHVMAFSRGEEFEADDLGIAFMQKAGYNPLASSTMLSSLAAQTALESQVRGDARTTPRWAMSHPDPAARVTRSLELARSMAAARGEGRRVDEAFLLKLKGMLYGDDPKQGVLDGQNFIYPPDQLRFTVPDSYGMANGATAVTITPKSGQGGGEAEFSGGAFTGSLDAYLTRAFTALTKDQSAVTIKPTALTINSMPAAAASAGAKGSDGAAFDVTIVAVQVAPGKVYGFTVKQPKGQGLGDLAPMVNSLRRISAAEASATRARVIDVVAAKAGDTVKSMAARMAYSDMAEQRFRVLNGLPTETTALTAGGRYKLVVWSGAAAQPAPAAKPAKVSPTKAKKP